MALSHPFSKGKKAAFVLPSATGSKIVSEHSSPADDGKDWNLPLIVGTEMTERTTAPQPVQGKETTDNSGLSPLAFTITEPLIPFFIRSTINDNSGVSPLAFTITKPSVPFLFCPVYISTETGTPDASTSHFSWNEGSDNNDSGQSSESSEKLDQSEMLTIGKACSKDSFAKIHNFLPL
ncbi:hypothetical protein V6N12_022522 [Hibiscus sabdariffa]|uniref:Uncharacterized protein n=1 Tax=Hibiscus sabdariffa TaxID=183260 RepID=A0ABR2FUX7_9ROSI